jgi:integrase/recombinase XerD
MDSLNETPYTDSTADGEVGRLAEYLSHQHPASTVKVYLRDIHIFLQEHTAAKTYNYKQIVQYVGALRNRYTKPANINRILCAIKKYYQYLCYIGQRSDNPAKAARLRDYKTKPLQLQDLLTANELHQLLEPKKERYAFLSVRNRVIMSLLVYQAVRAGEAVQLETSHINLREGTIFIPATGHTNSRTLPLKAEQIMLLYEYLTQAREKLITQRTRGSTRLLLSKLGEALKTEEILYIVERSKHLFPAKRLTVQAIRMSVVMHLLDAGGDIRTVQVFAGHKHPSTTELYRRTQVQTLKMEIQKYHPLQ